MILPAIPQRTAESRLVAPTPIIDALMQWVVLTGIPQGHINAPCEAISITVAAEASGKAMNWSEGSNPHSNCFNNPPAADSRTRTNSQG